MIHSQVRTVPDHIPRSRARKTKVEERICSDFEETIKNLSRTEGYKIANKKKRIKNVID